VLTTNIALLTIFFSLLKM